MNRNLLIVLVIIVVVGAGVFLQKQEKDVSYNIIKNSSNNVEYEFDGRNNPESGSWDILRQLERDNKTLHGNANIVSDDQSMQYVEILKDEKKEVGQGQQEVLQKYVAGTDAYELRNGFLGYSIYKNRTLLFKRNMEFGADGPILDWRIIDGKPAFTVRLTCVSGSCTNDIFYDGEFMSEKYNVEDPRYLFTYNGKIGFVAKDEGKDRIFFDGGFIAESFDTIHTYNCCSIRQILPTVYENGTLLFYGARGDKGYLAEIKLQ